MKSRSVERRLILTLILLQVVSVALLVCVFSVLAYTQRDSNGAIYLLIDQLAPHLQTDATGQLTIDPEGMAMVRKRPGSVWLYASDETRALTVGPVPDRLRPFLPQAKDIVRDIGAVEEIDTPAGPLTVVAGASPALASDVPLVVRSILTSVVTFILLPGVVFTLIAVPFVVRRQMAPITTVAEAAERLEAGRPGQRLPQHNAPAEVAPLIRAVNGALDRLDQWAAAQRRFVADAAHELRTPITVLQIRLDGLPPGPVTDDLKEDCRRLARMADRLLEIERIRSAKLGVKPVDLNDLAQEAAIQFAPRAVDMHADLALEAAPTPVRVHADPEAILACLINLLDNAVRHGGPAIVISVQSAPVPAISVTDSGPGVRPDLVDRLFDPFVGTPGRGGAGLGLTLVQEIMQAHGGRVRHLRTAGGQTRFHLEFPKEAPARQG